MRIGKRAALAACLLSLLAYGEIEGQGVTTSAITGRVLDSQGAPLVGAQVTIINRATGAQRTTLTREDGRYYAPGLRPGGPYRVEVQYIGHATESLDDLQLALGENRSLDFTLRTEAVALQAIQVTAEGNAALQTGVSTVVDERTLNSAPALGREFVDVVRFTPQAFVSNEDDDGAAISIAGQSAEYNGLFVDGVVNNDVFGLSAQGTNGGQTGAPPISFDALEQIQIALSPFDVTQSGFTGGAINAITRSGTNEFRGSFYYQFRNEQLAGKTPGPDFLFDGGERTGLPEFSNQRYGFRLGGPIVRNKAFFFVNGEIFRSETPRPYTPGSYQGASGDAFAAEVRQILIDELGYDPGGFGSQASTLDDNKFLAKLDWNINEDHRLSARHSYSHSDNVDAFGSSRFSLNYVNNREVFPNTTNSSAIELNSRFGDTYSNRLLIGATFVRDDRGFAGDPFPSVTIEDGNGTVFLGSEAFSTGNILNQDIYSITNNLNIFRGRHTFTVGAHFEYYDIFNLFIRQNFGQYTYASMDDFLQSVCAAGNGSSAYCQNLATQFGGNIPFAEPDGFQRGYSLVDNEIGDASDAAAAFSAYQIGLYAQDDVQLTDRLRVTAGLRIDVPKITTKPRFSDDVFDTTIRDIEAAGHDLEGATPGETPKAMPYFAPRLGFTYDLPGERNATLRGGVGLFTGRVPFVYPGAMYTNNGVTTGFVSRTTLPDGSPVPFIPDARNQLTASDFNLPDRPNGELDLFTENFRYPRVFRTSLGVDANLPWGLTGTLEGQYTKTLDNIIIQNVNFKPQNATLNGPDRRRVYNYGYNSSFNSFDVDATLIDPRYANGIYKVGSTSEGYAYDITASIGREFLDGALTTRLAYTYGDSYSLNDATSDQIASTFRFNENVNGLNNLELARSDWSIGHRVLGLVTFRKEFLGSLATTISAVYSGESGRPYSFIIGNNFGFTGEGSGTAPLAYIPENASDLQFCDLHENFRCAGAGGSGAVILTAAEQAEAFEAFISNNDYLDSRRGDYAERNALRTPFEHVVDLRLSQELFTNVAGRRNTVELTLDIFNLTNLLNREWGIRYNPGFRTVDLLRFERFVSADDLTPIYSFRFPTLDSSEGGPGVETMDEYWRGEVLDFGNYGSRWLMQIGLRYSF